MKGSTAMDLSTLEYLIRGSFLVPFGNSMNNAVIVAINKKIKVLLVKGFFCSSVKGFPIAALELVRINPMGLLSYNQAISMANGNRTMKNKVTSFIIFCDILSRLEPITRTFQKNTALSIYAILALKTFLVVNFSLKGDLVALEIKESPEVAPVVKISLFLIPLIIS
jgi:hypothetical protein